MLNKLYGLLQQPKIPTPLLSRLLFSFNEPFDKEKAKTDWNYGGEERLDYKKLLFAYRYLFTAIFDVLDTVFSPYIDNRPGFVEPHIVVVGDFRFLTQFLLLIQTHLLFHLSYSVDVRSFNPLSGDYSRMIEAWSKERGRFLDDRAKIEDLCVLNAIPNSPAPYRLQKYVEIVRSNLKKQREFQNKHSKLPEELLSFTAEKSKKKSVYMMLLENKDGFISKKLIMRKTKNSYDAFRSVISQLRKDIRKQKLDKVLSIMCDGVGNYKLVDLASKRHQ